jgi:CHASE2 domain-containing sensor protein
MQCNAGPCTINVNCYRSVAGLSLAFLASAYSRALMRYMLIIPFALITLAACSQTGANTRFSEIVLVASSGEKCEVGQIIDAIDRCNPKVIGMNLLLLQNEQSICDRALLQAMSQSGKVVLVEGLHDALSDESYYLKAKYTGETGLAKKDSDSSASFYYRISPYSNGRISFPYFVALHYDKSKRPILTSQSDPRLYPLRLYYPAADFTTLTPKDLPNGCNQLEGKIVLVGQLNDGRNIRQTKFQNSQVVQLNETVLQANIILDILNDLDNKNVKINKYADYIQQQQLNRD